MKKYVEPEMEVILMSDVVTTSGDNTNPPISGENPLG